ncbi:MAG: ribonuclease III [Clostridia bacterium]|nr:ribonuclease III [Clostridia bacterium]
MNENDKLLRLQSKLKYIFNDTKLLKMALTHKSYAYEQANPTYDMYNERIEFLGDAILEHIISDLLFAQKPEMAEGEMTKKRAAIVCEASLSSAFKRIGGQEYIYLGKCEQNSNGKLKDAIVADAFEATLGAIYLDGGYDIARDICLELLDKEIKTVLNGGTLNTDYKTQLQEILQRHGNVKIEYILQKEEGPEHDKSFTIDLFFNGTKIGEGTGKSKKQAEQEAAHQAILNGGENLGN